MEDLDDFISTGGLKIEQPKDSQKVGMIYFILLFLSFIFIFAAHFLLILEGIGKSLPTFLKFPVG